MALIAQLEEHCTGIAEVVGSNPAQSLKIFSGLCSSSVTAARALMTVITQLLLWDKLLSMNNLVLLLNIFISYDRIYWCLGGVKVIFGASLQAFNPENMLITSNIG